LDDNERFTGKVVTRPCVKLLDYFHCNFRRYSLAKLREGYFLTHILHLGIPVFLKLTSDKKHVTRWHHRTILNWCFSVQVVRIV